MSTSSPAYSVQHENSAHPTELGGVNAVGGWNQSHGQNCERRPSSVATEFGNRRGRLNMRKKRRTRLALNNVESRVRSLTDASIFQSAMNGFGRPPLSLMEGCQQYCNGTQETSLNPNAAPFVPSYRSVENRREFGGNSAANIRGKMRLNHSASSNIPRCFVVRAKKIEPREESLQNLRDRLIEQLENNSYECMICCQIVEANQWIWTCQKCFHMFHISRGRTNGCITQWALKCRSESADEGWRCPSCQHVSYELPTEYKCFCGKEANPRMKRFPDLPHSCGGICGKSRGFGCPHTCTERCHPGPCPDCPLFTTIMCNCGRETKKIRCGSQAEFECSSACGKKLNCGLHTCARICHKGDCESCSQMISQKCYCSAEQRSVSCTAANLACKSYSCGSPCNGFYVCGVHQCTMKCHPKGAESDCGTCIYSPERINYCPCGRSRIDDLTEKPRKRCTDPIPTCTGVCSKVYPCGTKAQPHRCKELCHEGPCPPCQGTSTIKCRCKSSTKVVACSELNSYSDSNPYICGRRCKKMKSCQNHRCQEVCCVDTEHTCYQICGKKLSCGNHTCERLCHVGKCPRCLVASFEEQYCLCGHSVREPPIPCGTPLPSCDQPCSRSHPCSHPPMHNCHSEPECPPCTLLVKKPCFCGREMRDNIPCYLNEVSCGRPCEKPLPCGVHRCLRKCHAGPCMLSNSMCKQPCPTIRINAACEHPCGLPCHGTSPCCPSVCSMKLHVTCICGRRTGEMGCAEVERAYQKNLALKVAEEMSILGTFSSEHRVLQRSPSMDKYKCLPCDMECRRIMRNKKVANALNIATDADSNALDAEGQPIRTAPLYSDYLKKQVKTNARLVQEVEDALVELVQNVQMQASSTTQVHTFRPMSSDSRRFIHEYATYFRVETISYDAEPKRNVVATAKSGVSLIPFVLLTVAHGTCREKRSTAYRLCEAELESETSSSVPSLQKNYSWDTESGMQQLTSVANVVKRQTIDTESLAADR